MAHFLINILLLAENTSSNSIFVCIFLDSERSEIMYCVYNDVLVHHRIQI